MLYYQHQARRKDEFYLALHERLLREGGFPGASGHVLKFTAASPRYYLFFVQPRHREAVAGCLSRLLASPWRACFRALSTD